MKIDLVKNFNFDRNKIKVIYNPVHYKIEKAYDYKKIKKENFILVVGRLAKQKKHDIAIKIFSKIVSKYSKLKLKIAGKGDQKKHLRKLVYKYKIGRCVEFLGYKENLANLYKKANLTILTSAYEGLPNVLIESITLGTPVVSFDCPYGPREIIKNGINGFLVKNNDEMKFENKLIQALKFNWDREKIHKTAFAFKNKLILDKYEIYLSKIIKKT